jgi:hypothetical protein
MRKRAEFMRTLAILSLVWLALIGGAATKAWGQPPPPASSDLVYVCIEPASAGGSPYLITLRNTSVAGLVLPEDASVVVYSSLAFSSALYAIAPDAASGGYLPTALLAQNNGNGDVPIPTRPCAAQYPQIITATLLMTVPHPLSPRHALMIQLRDSQELDEPIIGVFSFHFRPSGAPALDFQLLQVGRTESDFDLSLPGFDTSTPEVPAVIVANKRFIISRSYTPEGPFGEAQVSEGRDFLLVAAGRQGYNIFQMMDMAQARLYPAYGAIYAHPTGGYFHLEANTEPPVREPAFAPGAAVAPLEGARADFFLPANPGRPFGALLSRDRRAQVVRVEPGTGQLFVRSPDDGSEVYIESWYVEVVAGP